MDHATLPDGELARLALTGRERAFAEIMRRHREPVYRLIRAYVGDPDEALDLTQETFVSVHQALRRYDPARPMRTWLSAIAVNKCRDWARKRAVRRFFSFAAPIEEAHVVADDRPGTEALAADAQELGRVSAAIAALPAPLKEVLILRTIEGLSQAEAAGVLGVSEKAVETRLHRARAKLAEMLESQSGCLTG